MRPTSTLIEQNPQLVPHATEPRASQQPAIGVLICA
jgi:hypothetical protein